jgi:8-oxo-dGTP diphosphatase
MGADAEEPIRIAAAVIRDDRGRHLLVRKAGTDAFMQAGGKIDPGEAPRAALERELREELGLEGDPARPPAYLGLYRAEAANEPGQVVEAHLFAVELSGAIEPGAEICEVIWLDPKAPIGVRLAPLTRVHVLRRPDGA